MCLRYSGIFNTRFLLSGLFSVFSFDLLILLLHLTGVYNEREKTGDKHIGSLDGLNL